jgi:hypothetical protein
VRIGKYEENQSFSYFVGDALKNVLHLCRLTYGTCCGEDLSPTTKQSCSGGLKKNKLMNKQIKVHDVSSLFH